MPGANVIKTSTGSWHAVFAVTALMNFAVVALALFVLKPIRRKLMAESNRTEQIESPPGSNGRGFSKWSSLNAAVTFPATEATGMLALGRGQNRTRCRRPRCP